MKLKTSAEDTELLLETIFLDSVSASENFFLYCLKIWFDVSGGTA